MAVATTMATAMVTAEARAMAAAVMLLVASSGSNGGNGTTMGILNTILCYRPWHYCGKYSLLNVTIH